MEDTVLVKTVLVDPWQQQRNPRASSRLAFGHKNSALQLRQPARRSQSEAAAPARLLGGEEGFAGAA